MQFSVYQESRIGGRKVNQDRMGYSYTREALLLVLADGMGGHLHGEIAATLTLQTVAALFREQAAPYIRKPARFLEQAALAAHEAIHQYSRSHGLSETPRTTVVLCLLQHHTAYWAHCGDSRLYWLRDGRLLARTRDHSHVENLIERGLVAPSARASHPDRNKLYNCLGANQLPRVELSPGASLLPGDLMLLCSDGLWAVLPEAELLAQLSQLGVVRAVPALLDAALAAAGKTGDNATALAIMWQGDGHASDPAGVIASETLAADQHSSTIAAPSAEGADAFDDAAIEQAIAEIRMAIEKSSQLLK